MANPDVPVKSPCISLCTLNEDDVCVGCYRTLTEIVQWTRLDNSQRRAVVELAGQRSKVGNPFA